jgi:hypothetical protein
MATVREATDEANAGVFARLVQKISNALLTGATATKALPGTLYRKAKRAPSTYFRQTSSPAKLISRTSKYWW